MCILYLHIDIKIFPNIFEVTDTAGPIILGRRHVKAMGYVNFPKIRQPHKPITKINASKKIYSLRVPTSHSNTRNAMNETCTHQPAEAMHMKQARQNSTVLVVPQIKWNENPIELNG